MVKSTLIVHSDIPDGMTCAEWRRINTPPKPTLLRRLIKVVTRDRS